MTKSKRNSDFVRPVFSRRLAEKAVERRALVDRWLDERTGAGDAAVLRALVKIGIEAVDLMRHELRAVDVIVALLGEDRGEAMAKAMKFAAELARDGHGGAAIVVRDAIDAAREREKINTTEKK